MHHITATNTIACVGGGAQVKRVERTARIILRYDGGKEEERRKEGATPRRPSPPYKLMAEPRERRLEYDFIIPFADRPTCLNLRIQKAKKGTGHVDLRRQGQ